MEPREQAELLIKLLSDEKFLARMNDTENDLEKMKALFASEGIELSDDKIKVIIDALNEAKKSMYNGEGVSEEDLNNISGGTSEREDLAEKAGETVKTIILAGGATVDKVKYAVGNAAQKAVQKGIGYAKKIEEDVHKMAVPAVKAAEEGAAKAVDGIKKVVVDFVSKNVKV